MLPIIADIQASRKKTGPSGMTRSYLRFDQQEISNRDVSCSHDNLFHDPSSGGNGDARHRTGHACEAPRYRGLPTMERHTNSRDGNADSCRACCGSDDRAGFGCIASVLLAR